MIVTRRRAHLNQKVLQMMDRFGIFFFILTQQTLHLSRFPFFDRIFVSKLTSHLLSKLIDAITEFVLFDPLEEKS